MIGTARRNRRAVSRPDLFFQTDMRRMFRAVVLHGHGAHSLTIASKRSFNHMPIMLERMLDRALRLNLHRSVA